MGKVPAPQKFDGANPPQVPPPAGFTATDWQRELSEAVKTPADLCKQLKIPPSFNDQVSSAAKDFRVLVPHSYLRRMEPGNPRDPLLLQVLPQAAENHPSPGFVPDALQEHSARIVPGLLQKYAGRALLITTGACAVHCRYCFRRHYPYAEEPQTLAAWGPALEALQADRTIVEVLLSGGDPLMLRDDRLAELVHALEAIPHIRRIRLHTRLPIVLPSRVTPRLLQLLGDATRTRKVVVVHANHPRELSGDCASSLLRLTQVVTVLNQSVLLRGVNDDADVLAELSERLFELGVMPYYLHQLDRVAGTAHFEVSEAEGRELMEELQSRLPGYLVPRYVREDPGAVSKTWLL